MTRKPGWPARSHNSVSRALLRSPSTSSSEVPSAQNSRPAVESVACKRAAAENKAEAGLADAGVPHQHDLCVHVVNSARYRGPLRPAQEDIEVAGFHRIRHYGLFANANRTANIALARRLLGVPD